MADSCYFCSESAIGYAPIKDNLRTISFCSNHELDASREAERLYVKFNKPCSKCGAPPPSYSHTPDCPYVKDRVNTINHARLRNIIDSIELDEDDEIEILSTKITSVFRQLAQSQENSFLVHSELNRIMEENRKHVEKLSKVVEDESGAEGIY